jgi:hypothetical protein
MLRADDASRIKPASCDYRPEPTAISRVKPPGRRNPRRERFVEKPRNQVVTPGVNTGVMKRCAKVPSMAARAA